MCLVHLELPAIDFLPIQGLDCRGRGIFGPHFHETETACTAGELVGDDTYRLDFAVGSEEISQRVFRGRITQITYIDLLGHLDAPFLFPPGPPSPRAVENS